MPVDPNSERRDDEVQEIISRPPGILVRWGLTVFSAVFVLFLFLTWFIQYPDIVKAKVIITTEPAPINLVSRTTGKIVLRKVDNLKIKTGDIVAFLESNAKPEDVMLADSLTALPDSFSNALNKTLTLGDLQNGFSQWQRSIENRTLFYQNQIAKKQIAHLEKQIASYKKLGLSIQGQLQIMRQEFALAKSRYKTDSTLFQQNVTSAVDFNKAKADFLGQQRNLKTAEMNLINNDLQVTSLEKQITELESNQLENERKVNLDVQHAREELRAQILKWKETYLFIAPISGSLTYLDFLEGGKFIEAGKPIFSIIPASNEIIGRAELPIAGSGKVKEGQRVNIRLDNFPYEQFGMIQGQVSEISSMPSQDKYLVVIDLPDTLTTTAQKNLVFKQQMQGETEIVTEDLRLLERFFYQFIKLIKSR